ncbi:DMT family transporter [Rhodococcus sp. NCIMB 12038]|uniref:DMT family transporter n=1 Tax=Rhodococcus sp. NCIMB 12038 TaxID=933800 RepID=UPI0015C5D71B|nr:DMT family transporter [Rhodococcus sp. NCIMB 12038]
MTGSEAVRERPDDSSPLRVTAAFVSSFAAGVAVSVQTYLNGRLGVEIGSSQLAAGVSTLSGLIVALVAALGSGAVLRAWRSARRATRPIRRWWFLCGCLGTAAMWANTAAAPVTGIALVALAAVFGKLTGGLTVDALGLSPRGRLRITGRRVAGAACALASVLVGPIGYTSPAAMLFLALVALAGIGIAIQQSGNGHLVVVTGEPLAMGAVNFAAGALLTAVVLTANGALPIGEDVSIPLWGVAGGILGVAIAVVGGYAVSRIGVMALMISQITGQNIGALVLDKAAPLNGHDVGAGAVLGATLASAAVWVTYHPRPGAVTGFHGRRSGR